MSWRERERAEVEWRTEGGAGRAAAEVRAEGAEAGWAGSGHTDWAAVTKRRQPRRAPGGDIASENVGVGDTAAAAAAAAELCSLREHARRFDAAGNTARGETKALAGLGEVAGAEVGAGSPEGAGAGGGGLGDSGVVSARRRAAKIGAAGVGARTGAGVEAAAGAGVKTGRSVSALKPGLRENGSNRPGLTGQL